MSDMTPGEAAVQTNLLGAALYTYATDERDKAFEYLQELSDRPGIEDITIMFMLANWIVSIEGDAFESGQFHGFEVVDMKTGQIKNPDGFDDSESMEAAAVWCMRMLTATANKDFEQQRALIGATPTENSALGRMRMMVHLAGESMRAQIEKAKAS